MKRQLLLLVVLLSFFSCSKPEEPENEFAIISYNDFEALDGWVEIPPTVNRERAYSGKYSIKIDLNNEYSLAFQKQLGQITEKRPKKFKLSAMAYVPGKETGNAALVFSLDKSATDNEPVHYAAIKMNEVSSYRKWVKVSQEIELPENATPNNLVKIYLWRGDATEPVYVDDLKLSVMYE